MVSNCHRFVTFLDNSQHLRLCSATLRYRSLPGTRQHLPRQKVETLYNQGWQVVAKSGFNHWFLPVKIVWQKMWVAKSGKK